MKKLLKVLLVVGMMLLGAACGGEKTEEKVYIVGTNAEFPPFEYLEGNKIVGFDPDLMDEIAKRLNIKYEWNDMTFDGLIPALQTKKVDIVIAGMSVSEERKKAVHFSAPYIETYGCFIVRKDSGFNSIEDLTGKKVGIEMGTTAEAMAEAIKDKVLMPFSGNTAALLALKSNNVDVIILDNNIADHYVANNPELKIAATANGETKALAFNLKDEKLRDDINKVIDDMKKDGTIDKLKAKYGME